ncbi:hypothetical protein [Parasphingopyxis marina]|uniref:Lipoprotein n=1 Tax=Parasphingopyxis marina TaxID=2761622 RepID=A0A842HTR7_9SPHN|nr:hypothetical protein [Parasphingopyxis marina]MBC2776476.1 hypothetical protein [Parasphingopyxis marina]
MTKRIWSALPLALALVACGGGEEAVTEPAALELTPGSWAANDEQASFADLEGNLLATFRCDTASAELILEAPGDFPDGARPAMLLRAGDFMHGVDPVEVRGDASGPIKVARLPSGGPISRTLMTTNAPMTIETESAPAVMLENGEALQGFLERCANETGQETSAIARAGASSEGGE